ncbi:DUF4442 domain-containing protein [Aliikangiella coralliicola]|uniref:DUF4442 domain-containing protein n=1 Tax=Aliikangiella coralliicola TaxID=2592383 RepID=A0A545UEL9_9GAMM|nr:DUF4442 domain-containing protein [Aliikangiella coralliicola]TQV87917.1 DUF4442 domain-containing protein [Aliikangiella coralliicola]
MKFTPKGLKRLLNIYPPYLGAGVKITHISDDWKQMGVRMKLRWYNRNAVGSHFGGSLYSMVDPQIMLMLMQILGPEYFVWDKSATIDYLQPATSEVTAEILIEDDMLALIKEETHNGEKYLPTFEVLIKDKEQNIIARVDKVLYIRKKPKHRN